MLCSSWWFLRLLTVMQRKLSCRVPVLERTRLYSHGFQIKSTRSQYRQCEVITVYQNSMCPSVAKDHSYQSGKKKKCVALSLESACYFYDCRTHAMTRLNTTDHSFLWPTAILQCSYTHVSHPLVFYAVVSCLICENPISLIKVAVFCFFFKNSKQGVQCLWNT